MKNSTQSGSPVAVIGIGCFFPGAPGLKPFWQLLFRERDAITDVPPSHWSREDYFDEDPKRPDHVYCSRGGFLSPVAFDPSEYGIPPSNLQATDTSQLLGLAAAKAALEDAGYGDDRDFDRDRTSVVLGVTGTQELVIPLGARLGHPIWRRALHQAGVAPETAETVIQGISDAYVPWQENAFPGLLGNVVAGRICNRLDFGGTNCVVDAACASSMGAIHLAMLELETARSNMVVTGGVDAINDIFMHMCFAKTQILSPTGDARPFSRDADGTVLGEGIGMLIFKRLADAERDGDRIYAVIRGIGSASDGRSQSIYAPRVQGQTKALRRAYEKAGVDPASVGLIEAHGTGTRVGDAVEFRALRDHFGAYAAGDNRCAVGAVKSMIGHTKAAAGAAGLIKAVLALHHKVLPPTLKISEPDPGLELEDSPFYLNTRLRPWMSDGFTPRRAGVSAFGFGGSNYHAVLEEYRPEKSEISWDGSVEILAFSGANPEQVRQRVRSFQNDLRQVGDLDAASHQAGGTRKSFSHRDPCRLTLIAPVRGNAGDLRDDWLRRLDAARGRISDAPPRSEDSDGEVFFAQGDVPGGLAFLFPGQGSQYLYMGRDILCMFPQAMECLACADETTGGDDRLSDRIYPIPAFKPELASMQENRLRETQTAQPAIGAVSAAMLAVLRYFGAEPDAVAGHSFGELTALYAAGRISEGDFHRLAAARGRIMYEAAGGPRQDAGAMLAVNAPLERLASLVENETETLVLANRNSPKQGVFSGSSAAVSRLEERCREQGLPAVRLPVAAAFHSPLLGSAGSAFRKELGNVSFREGSIPVFANTTAAVYPNDPSEAKRILAEQIRHPVDFTGMVEALYAAGCRTFVEVGPGSVLSGLVRRILEGRPSVGVALDPAAGKRSGTTKLAAVLCRLASMGYPIRLGHWEKLAATPRKRRMNIPLSGANYRPKGSAGESRPSSDPAAAAAATPLRKTDLQSAVNEKNPTVPASPRPASETRTISNETMNESLLHHSIPSRPPVSESVSEAMSTIQEGLRSLQTLQHQTAEAHRMFLENQTEISRNIQALMQQAGTLAGWSASPEERSMAPAPERPERRRPALQPEDIRRPVPVADVPVAAVPDTLPPPASEPRQTRTAAQEVPSPQPETPASSAVSASLKAVVSELTGYPEEMLSADMDIEADLGIDSIKRVEILSTLEERVPGLPPVSPEAMAELKTLGQIAAYLDAGGSQDAQGAQAAPEARVAPAQPAGAGTAGAVSASLKAVVSELTGYPEEMLSADMDIEADLGIDSIKRVEILSTLEERVPGLPPVSPEAMAELKTLGQIAAYLDAGEAVAPKEAASTAAFDASAAPSMENALDARASEPRPPLPRTTPLAVPQRRSRTRSFCPAGGAPLWVTEDGSGLGAALVQAWQEAGYTAALLSEPEQDRMIEGRLPGPATSGLVIVHPCRSMPEGTGLRRALLLARSAAPVLSKAARAGGVVFATVSRLDGAFGLHRRPLADPIEGGLAGLAKTAALEWEGILCRALDVAPDWSEADAAKSIAAELLHAAPGQPMEIGLGPEERIVVETSTAPALDAFPDIGTEDVFLITGGARGITSAAVKELARRYRPKLVLLGRSPAPGTEPEWLSPLSDPAAMKRAILENEFQGRDCSPLQLEDRFRRYMAAREIRGTLEAVSASGAEACYRSVDARDGRAVEEACNAAREAFGPITGLIHGAGLLEDRRIADKTAEQFDRVFGTKVEALQHLLRATQADPLRRVVLFSSVAARFGNRGQSDYAMANEALNKIAADESLRRPSCRVVAVNWGPWDGGMVDDALRREFRRRGVPLIAVRDGVESLLREMAAGTDHPVEVVIGTPLADAPAAVEEQGSAPERPLTVRVQREIDVDRYPVLLSHVLDGKPVVPLALMAEWLGHGALHDNPGLQLVGLDDLRVLQGIRLEGDGHRIRLLAGKASRKGADFEVDVEIRDGYNEDGTERVHSRARALLSDHAPQPPDFQGWETIARKPYPHSIRQIYEAILFHGKGMRGIREIIGFSSEGMVARLERAPAPEQWIREPLRSRWLADPLVLDAAFQMAILWCHEEQNSLCLPSYSARYRQYRHPFSGGDITAVLEVRSAKNRKMVGDVTFLEDDCKVVARLEGYEAVMNPSLAEAFRKRSAA